jgi:putative ABC transport system substrate-binding protein
MIRGVRYISVAAALTVTITATIFAHPASTPAQKRASVPRIGFIHAGSPPSTERCAEAFRGRLHELGYVEGENLLLDERWGTGRIDRFRQIAEELVQNKVDIIVTHSAPAALVVHQVTQTIPIVAVAGDPLSALLVARIVRPQGNITEVPRSPGEGLSGKWLELLKEMAPAASDVAVLWNSAWFDRLAWKDLRIAALAQHLTLRSVEVQDPSELQRAFAAAERQAQALIVIPDPLTMRSRAQIAGLAATSRLPAIYGMEEFVDAGGLMAYSTSQVVLFRRAAVYVDSILRSTKPPDEDPFRFQLVLNLKTARALGRTVPHALLMRADRLVE